MIYDAMNNFLSQQLFENFCKFINNQYFIYEGMRLEAEQARYINFINSIHCYYSQPTCARAPDVSFR